LNPYAFRKTLRPNNGQRLVWNQG